MLPPLLNLLGWRLLEQMDIPESSAGAGLRSQGFLLWDGASPGRSRQSLCPFPVPDEAHRNNRRIPRDGPVRRGGESLEHPNSIHVPPTIPCANPIILPSITDIRHSLISTPSLPLRRRVFPAGLLHALPPAGGSRRGRGGAREDPGVPHVQHPAGRAHRGHRALRAPGGHGRQRILGSLRQAVSEPGTAPGWSTRPWSHLLSSGAPSKASGALVRQELSSSSGGVPVVGDIRGR